MRRILEPVIAIAALAALSCSKGAGVAASGAGGAGAGPTASSAHAASGPSAASTSTSGGGGTGGATVDAGPPSPCSGATQSTAPPGTAPPSVALTVPAGFEITPIAEVPAARQLVALPNGDLLVATNGSSTYLVPNADTSGAPGAPVVFATPSETPAQGIAFDPKSCSIYLSSNQNIYRMAYADGQQSADPGTPIANVRTGPISPNRPPGDTDDHKSTSVAIGGGVLYAGAGSSCNACVETDPTRAAIQQMAPDGSSMTVRATRFRNAIALTFNPATGTLWAGGAGQDDLAEGHPYEFFNAVGLHPGVADYGWPACEEDHVAYVAGSSCGATVAPRIEMPAYSTIIAAAFYPSAPKGPRAFPAAYRGGVFLAAHGSWHTGTGGTFVSAPQVVFVAMNGDAPKTPVDWTDPTAQWTQFVGGFQLADGKTRIARPTGLAVGPLGSLFIADDQNGYVYRVRPM